MIEQIDQVISPYLDISLAPNWAFVRLSQHQQLVVKCSHSLDSWRTFLSFKPKMILNSHKAGQKQKSMA